MNATFQPPGRRSAFTLFEVLIAAMAFAIVLAAINGIFYGGLRLRNKTVEKLEKSLPLQYALPVIKRDLANLVPPGGILAGELQSTVTGLANPGQISPHFYTASAVIDQSSPWSQVQKVSYALLASTNQPGVMDLYRLVQRNLLAPLEEPPASQWLLGSVRDITFFYLKDAQWLETWDSTVEESKLPAGIKVVIQQEPENRTDYAPAPVEIVVPILTQARTNETAEAESELGEEGDGA